MSEENTAPVATDGEDTAAVMAALNGDKTYLKDPEDTPELAKVEDEPGDDAAAATVEAKAPKPKQSAQERIDELTAARREAERDRDFYKEQALRGGSKAQPAQEAPDTPQGDGQPDPNDYATDEDYQDALIDHRVERAVERRLAERGRSDQLRSTVESYATREKAQFPDGDTPGLKAFKQVDTLPQGVFDVIGASDIGPKLAEHLGNNPAELARLDRLSPSLQAREMTLLETRLATPPKPTAKTATDAPEPPPQVRGSGGHFKPAGDTDDFAAFEKAYRIGG